MFIYQTCYVILLLIYFNSLFYTLSQINSMKNIFRINSNHQQELTDLCLLGPSFHNLEFILLRRYIKAITYILDPEVKILILNKILRQQNQSSACTLKHLIFLNNVAHESMTEKKQSLTKIVADQINKLISIEEKRKQKEEQRKKDKLSSSFRKLVSWVSDSLSFSKQKSGSVPCKLTSAIALCYAQYLRSLCSQDFNLQDIPSMNLTRIDMLHIINVCKKLKEALKNFSKMTQYFILHKDFIFQLSYSFDNQIKYLYPKLDKYCILQHEKLIKKWQQLIHINNMTEKKIRSEAVVRECQIMELITIYEEVKIICEGFNLFYCEGYRFANFQTLKIKRVNLNYQNDQKIDLCLLFLETAQIKRQKTISQTNRSTRPKHPILPYQRQPPMFTHKRTSLIRLKNEALIIKKQQQKKQQNHLQTKDSQKKYINEENS